jgi:hypothetical protein
LKITIVILDKATVEVHVDVNGELQPLACVCLIGLLLEIGDDLLMATAVGTELNISSYETVPFCTI